LFGFSSLIEIIITGKKENFKRYGKGWSFFLLKIYGVKLEIIYDKNFDQSKNFIFCPNHSSLIDIPVVFKSIDQYIVFLYKKELSRIPIFKTILDFAGFFYVDRSNSESAKKSMNLLLHDLKTTPRSVVIFPEGTRSKKGNLIDFKKGAAVFSLNSGLPIIPVAIIGGRNWWETKKVKVIFGKEINTENFNYEHRIIITEKIKNRIQTLLEKYC
jgi:1-acyl-sn-glycerol-3-phosphate acyltransferase